MNIKNNTKYNQLDIEYQSSSSATLSCEKRCQKIKRSVGIFHTPNEDPFGTNKYVLTEIDENSQKPKQKHSSLLSLDLLRKNYNGKENALTRPKKLFINRIVDVVKLYSTNTLDFTKLNYYIYPLEQNIRNDDSFLYKLMLKTFFDSLKSVYMNYKKNKTFFLVKFQDYIITFGKDRISIAYENTVSEFLPIVNILTKWDIAFTEEKDRNQIIINDNPNMVVDLIGNCLTKIEIPFILSYTRFNYGIYRNIDIFQKDVVCRNNMLQYYYESDGFVFLGDCEFYKNVSSSVNNSDYIDIIEGIDIIN